MPRSLVQNGKILDEQLGGTILESQGKAQYKKGKITKMIQNARKDQERREEQSPVCTQVERALTFKIQEIETRRSAPLFFHGKLQTSVFGTPFLWGKSVLWRENANLQDKAL